MDKENALNWVRGLSSFLEFDNDLESKKFIDFLENSMYAENPVIDSTNQAGMVEFISVLRKFAPNPVFDIIHKYYRSGHDSAALQDAFSRGQVLSKIWLAEELSIIQNNFKMIHIHAGWFGQLRMYLDIANITYDKMRIFDIDPIAREISDKIFNNALIKNYKVKSANLNVTNPTWLHSTGCEYDVSETITEKTIPDLIVNTSAEHFNSSWYHKFVLRKQSSDPLYVIQSNNLFSVDEHVNCVHNIDEMLKKFPMSRLYYSGEKELYGYKRFMLIGRP